MLPPHKAAVAWPGLGTPGPGSSSTEKHTFLLSDSGRRRFFPSFLGFFRILFYIYQRSLELVGCFDGRLRQRRRRRCHCRLIVVVVVESLYNQRERDSVLFGSSFASSIQSAPKLFGFAKLLALALVLAWPL